MARKKLSGATMTRKQGILTSGLSTGRKYREKIRRGQRGPVLSGELRAEDPRNANIKDKELGRSQTVRGCEERPQESNKRRLSSK